MSAEAEAERAKDLAFARVEFDTLRAEILGRIQSQFTLITGALTATAAIGTIALAKDQSRLEVLLILPYVLSALGLLLIDASMMMHRAGDYLRLHVVPQLTTRRGDEGEALSWEQAQVARVPVDGGPLKVSSVVGWFPIVLVVVLPSVVALAVNFRPHGQIWWLWGGGVAALLVFGWAGWNLRRR